MATALAPLMAPIVGAARTHRARLTGAARGCVSPDDSASARVRARPHVAPPHAPRKKANRHAGQRRKRRKARRERSRAKRWRKRRKARPEPWNRLQRRDQFAATVRRHRVPAIIVSMSFHRACHAVCVTCVCGSRASRMCMYACAWRERERERERERSDRRERERGARARRERRHHCRATSATARSCSLARPGWAREA